MTNYERQQKRLGIVSEILRELERAETIHPTWPRDPVHQAAVMVEEAGETMQAALDFYYHDKPLDRIRVEAIQTGAMAIRLLLNLGKNLPYGDKTHGF